MIWFDYSFSEQDLSRRLHEAAAAGATGIVRYIAGPGYDDKTIDDAEVNAARAAGLSIMLVWQRGGRPDRMVYSDGRRDGLLAVADASRLGYPHGAVIFWTCDTPGASWPSCRSYAQGWADAMAETAHRYRTGVYGPRAVWAGAIAEGLAEFSWQPETWTPFDAQDADMVQMVNSRRTVWGGASVDENQLRRPLPVWNPSHPSALVIAGADSDRPAAGAHPSGRPAPYDPEDNPMQLLRTPDGTLFLVRNGRKARYVDVLAREVGGDPDPVSTADALVQLGQLQLVEHERGVRAPWANVPDTEGGWAALALIPWQDGYRPDA